ncbi:membrane protein [Paenibacillus tyrfis]|uniref:Membrane protein n=1 Tax=Paenibacillus tyrfis TaxID=1501230 RepID=A0A081PB21_9BACL|nr:membrane protein [Paenibacillus tyrfis]
MSLLEGNNRLHVIDGLRGFSLLGILMANMLIFQYGIWGKDELQFFALSPADTVVHKLVKIFVEGSFMPIFTFLFGFGMIKMKESMEARSLKAGRHLVRRFLMLLGLGLLHSTYLWEGDILAFYGMMGFFLLIFMNRKAKTLLIWGTILLCLFGLLGLAPLFTGPMFLFGMYAAKKQWFIDPVGERSAYLRGMLIFLPAGLLLKSLKPLFPQHGWAGIGEMLGGSILALGYIFGFALLCSAVKKSPWLRRFEAVGKLSMTNYLMQSAICTSIFYGYSLGLFGKLGVAIGCGLAVAIYVMQLFASAWYVKRFSFGPMERLLRMWTYFSFAGKPKPRIQQQTVSS